MFASTVITGRAVKTDIANKTNEVGVASFSQSLVVIDLVMGFSVPIE